MPMSRPKILLVISMMGVFSIAGCNDGVGNYGVGCPALKSYSAEDQKAAAAEIRRNPNGQLAKMVRDYGQLRKACRV